MIKSRRLIYYIQSTCQSSHHKYGNSAICSHQLNQLLSSMNTYRNFTFMILAGLFFGLYACNPANKSTKPIEGHKTGEVNFNTSQKTAIKVTKGQLDSISMAWKQLNMADKFSPPFHFQEIKVEKPVKDSLIAFLADHQSLFLAMGEVEGKKNLYIFNQSDIALQVSLEPSDSNIYGTDKSVIARTESSAAIAAVEALKAQSNYDQVVGFVLDNTLLNEMSVANCDRFTITRRAVKSGKSLALSFENVRDAQANSYWMIPEENLCPFNCDGK